MKRRDCKIVFYISSFFVFSDVHNLQIHEKVCKYFELSKNQLLGKDRKKELSYARQICIYLIDEMLEMPYTSIGKIFNKDHATIIYCKNKVQKLLKTDKLLQTQIKDIQDLCKSKKF